MITKLSHTTFYVLDQDKAYDFYVNKLGFKVKELMGGIEWWKFDGYATEGTKSKKGLQIQCAC